MYNTNYIFDTCLDKHGYAIDASQELLALGFCNLIGCWFQIYPVSGVLSLATVVEV